MKRITLLTIVSVALMALSACNKEEVPASKTLKLDLNIIHNSYTKAIKTGWESGDKIYFSGSRRIILLLLTLPSHSMEVPGPKPGPQDWRPRLQQPRAESSVPFILPESLRR